MDSVKKQRWLLCAVFLFLFSGIILYTTLRLPRNPVSVSAVSSSTASFFKENTVLSYTERRRSNQSSVLKSTAYSIPVQVNINTADVEELMRLQGIGETKACAIVSYRNQHGNFTRKEDLLNVKGIGEKILEEIYYDILI